MNVRLLGACISMVALFSPASVVFGYISESPARAPVDRRWPVTYQAGTGYFEKDTRFEIAVRKDLILCQAKKAAGFTIPVSSIEEVAYDSHSRRRVKEGALTALTSVTTGVAIGFIKTTQHFVRIVWQESGKRQVVVFRVDKEDYWGFLEALHGVTGKPWRNLAKERKDTVAELKRIAKDREKNPSKRISVNIDREVFVNGSLLKPGLYEICFLKREGKTGEIFFFKGWKIRAKEIAATADSEVEEEAASGQTAKVSYIQDARFLRIQEIQTSAGTYRIR